MKKIIGLAMLAGAAAGVGPAHAEGEISANVTLTSNYMWRGFSQSDGAFAVQGGVDYANGVFYTGVWASSVDDFGVGAASELDLYVGVTPTLGPIEFDISLLGYFYPGADADIDMSEFMVAGAYSPTERFTIGAASYVSDDYAGTGDDSLYLELNGAYAFNDRFALSAAFGNQDLDSAGDYDTWNIGATIVLHGFALDLRYHDTDISGLDEEISFSISRQL